MLVQEYLKKNGIESLISEFKIKTKEYDKIVVLNYDQIESPRFHPIVDECRALILERETWNVVARAFDRFYNLGEGVQNSNNQINKRRVASLEELSLEEFNILNAKIQKKLDGSIILVYFYGGKWNYSTRGTAFGEGQSNYGTPFSSLFEKTKEYKNVMFALENLSKDITFIFELTTPENRVVTPFEEYNITLIGARNNKTGDELGEKELENVSKIMKVNRPEEYTINTYDGLIELVNNKPWMDEGVVLVFYKENGSHVRIKLKNPKYIAISNIRSNGNISPRNILRLIMLNEQEEYLTYFETDKKYFEFIEDELNKLKYNVNQLSEKYMSIEDQKTFAITINKEIKNNIEGGILFKIRKTKENINKVINDMGYEKLYKSLNLKEKFKEKFNIEDKEDKEE